ncbi:MAG: M48 family metallopeptidase [Limimaricola soesokkakensis]|uniref:Peptidase M48-like protein n=1 Tax=Limimaricola soesokkakensis TaxID=1343159 RepID=A0A1X6YV54_9RHOB|nr:M48 family metallopeptidase [Limimaricola soesokkakensis]PSK87628.1 peptidase M48-like protein [Limimaricola soesokkakensis]SLN32017.1 Peptidase family M48 [Limimaricola soesokkakensis]
MLSRLTLLALAAGLGLSACAPPVVVATGPQRTTTVTRPGTPAPTQVTVSKGPGVVADPDAARVAARNFVQVVERLEPVAEQVCRANAPQLDCDFRIVVDDRPGQPANAYQTRDAQGRPILAFTVALLGEVRNADELAFVLSHEAAHHIAGHLDRQSRNAAIGATVFGQLASGLGGGNADVVRTAQQIGAGVGARSYSKDFELEADALGTTIAKRAGYDPVNGAQFFLRIPDPGDAFLGTHPPNAQRMEIVRRTAAGL